MSWPRYIAACCIGALVTGFVAVLTCQDLLNALRYGELSWTFRRSGLRSSYLFTWNNDPVHFVFFASVVFLIFSVCAACAFVFTVKLFRPSFLNKDVKR
jgi:hypothetical protein